MDHFKQNFIDFGCNNKEFIRGMSSWAADKKVAVLKKILGTGLDGEASSVTEMELAVIENQLETYFGE